MSNYVILGGGGHASSIHDLLLNLRDSKISFCSDSYPPNFPIQYRKVDWAEISRNPNQFSFALGVGEKNSRAAAINKFQEIRFLFPPLVHPSAYVSQSATLGFGTVVFANAYVGPEVKIGDFAIVNTSATIEHGSTLSDFTILSPAVTVAGNVRIGKNTFFGMSSSVSENLDIGDDCTIGANSFVNKSIKSGNRVFGTPGRVWKK